jgi:phosphate transport system protein
MREAFQEQLDDMKADLAQMAQEVAAAVRISTAALLHPDLRLAEQVIGDDRELDARQRDIQQRAFDLLARQPPVGGDLRTLVSALRMVDELERMGDLAAHVAKIVRLRYPQPAVPASLRPAFLRMGDVAEKMVVTAGHTLADLNLQGAQELRDRDDEMNDLRSTQFRVLLGDDWPHGIEAAVDVALLGRYYERIADHAASMAGRVVYVVTGDHPDA